MDLIVNLFLFAIVLAFAEEIINALWIGLGWMGGIAMAVAMSVVIMLCLVSYVMWLLLRRFYRLVENNCR